MIRPAILIALSCATLSAQLPSALEGDAGVEDFGYALAAADLDGDGREELLVGAPRHATNGSTARGRLVIFSGRGGSKVAWIGADASHGLGSAIAVGDLDGDGHQDVAVSAPRADAARGQVHIFFGDESGGAILAGGDLAGRSSGATVLGPDPQSEFGAAIAIGDLDGDGLGELIVGAPASTVGTTSRHAGKVWILRGRKDWPRGVHTPNPKDKQARLVTGRENEALGRALLAADAVGDELMDLVIGGPGLPRGGRPGIGAVSVLAGRKDLFADAAAISWDHEKPALEVRGQDAGFGRALAMADADGDGRPELVLGDPGAKGARGEGAGRVIILTDRSKPRIELAGSTEGFIVHEGAVAHEGFGEVLAAVDIDGRRALAVGLPKIGRAFLWQDFGPSARPLRVLAPRGGARSAGQSIASGRLLGADGKVLAIGAPAVNRVLLFP